MSQAGIINVAGGGGSVVEFLQGNSGGPVGPTANVINVIGAGGVLVAGNPGTSTLTITASGGATPWTDEAVSFNAAVSNGYFVTGTATATLPASPSQGNTISFAVDTSSLLTIKANTGQKIRIGQTISASAGTAVNQLQGDSVTLVYRSSDTTWIADSVIGDWTVT